MPDDIFELFHVAPPGLEHLLAAELQDKGFSNPVVSPGGATTKGPLSDVVRANTDIRGSARVLLRIAGFRAMHLAQLDKRARKVDWAAILRPDTPIHVEATCRKSRIYHNRAAAERISKAINETLGCSIDADAAIRIKVRIDDDFCTISVDTSGEALHKRGLKGAMGKAPLRENLAALSLRACGFTGGEPVVDPMCGSGTFVIEAAEIARALTPGRARKFAFEDLAIDISRTISDGTDTPFKFHGFDRDAGAVKSATNNAARAGVADNTSFTCQPLSDLRPPEGPPGLVMINPPYGGRIGNKKMLYGLYGAIGQVMRDHFSGWRMGLVTSEPSLAKACRLEWSDIIGPFPNGGIRVSLYHWT